MLRVTMEPPMPAWILAAVVALGTAMPILIISFGLLAPLMTRWLDENLAAKDADSLKRITSGAYHIIAALAKTTPTTLDDSLAKLLAIADREFRLLKGRPMTKEERGRAEHIAVSLHANENVPGDLGRGDLAREAIALSAPVPPSSHAVVTRS